jgi:predicted RNA-binding protein with EMAP domain
MNWYLAKMVFRIISGDGNHQAQFDEQLRLISASYITQALDKAQEIGIKGEELFFNKKHQLVRWQFIGVSELYLLKELTDGAEVYSKIVEKENAENYHSIIQKKAEQLRSVNTIEKLKFA